MAGDIRTGIWVRLSVGVFMLVFELASVWIIPLLALSFSNLGYLLAMTVTTWIALHDLRYGRGPTSRLFNVVKQIAWNANCMIVIVFWGYLYYQPQIKKLAEISITIHIRFIVVHIVPILALLPELYLHPTKYMKGDFKWTYIYYFAYMSLNAAQTYICDLPMYPMLTWRDWTTLLFILIATVLSYSFHLLGEHLSAKFSPTSPGNQELDILDTAKTQ